MWGHIAAHLGYHAVKHFSDEFMKEQQRLLHEQQRHHDTHKHLPYLNGLAQPLMAYLTELGYKIDEKEEIYLSAHQRINNCITRVVVFSGRRITPSCAFSSYLLAEQFTLGRQCFLTAGITLDELKTTINAMLEYPAPIKEPLGIIPPPLPKRYELTQ
jgi:hypothetical protein